MFRKKLSKLLSIAVLLLTVTVIGCYLEGNSNSEDNEMQPLHKITLEDNGEVVFYEDGPGRILTIISTNSEDVFEDLSRLNCIEICQKYGDGIVPENVRKAYEKYVELYGEDEEISEEGNNSRGGIWSYSPYRDIKAEDYPYISFELFCLKSALLFSDAPTKLINNTNPGFVKFKRAVKAKDCSYKKDISRMAIKNCKQDIETAKWAIDHITTCYIVSGAVRLKVERREGWSLFGFGGINYKWRTMGYTIFTKGQYGGIRCVGKGNNKKAKYRIKAKILPNFKNRTTYHLFLYAVRY